MNVRALLVVALFALVGVGLWLWLDNPDEPAESTAESTAPPADGNSGGDQTVKRLRTRIAAAKTGKPVEGVLGMTPELAAKVEVVLVRIDDIAERLAKEDKHYLELQARVMRHNSGEARLDDAGYKELKAELDASFLERTNMLNDQDKAHDELNELVPSDDYPKKVN